MGLIDVALEELVLSEGGRADRALVRQVRRLQRLLVVLGHVVEQLPLVDFAADRTPALVLALVGEVLHRGRDEAVRSQEVPLQTLVGEESELTLLAVEGRPVVNHLWMDFDLRRRKQLA